MSESINFSGDYANLDELLRHIKESPRSSGAFIHNLNALIGEIKSYHYLHGLTEEELPPELETWKKNLDILWQSFPDLQQAYRSHPSFPTTPWYENWKGWE